MGEQRVDKRAVGIAGAGMDDEAGRLVDHDDVGVLVQHRQRDSLGPRGGRLRRWVLRYDLRKPFAAIGVGLHLGILALLNVGPFSPISLSYYLCLIPPRVSEGDR